MGCTLAWSRHVLKPQLQSALEIKILTKQQYSGNSDKKRIVEDAGCLVGVRSSTYGHVTTSDYIYEEGVAVTQMCRGEIEAEPGVGRRIRGEGYPAAIKLLYSSPTLFG